MAISCNAAPFPRLSVCAANTRPACVFRVLSLPLQYSPLRVFSGTSGQRSSNDAQYGQLSLGELVRSIMGLSQKAVSGAFSRFLNDAELGSGHMHFVRQIVNYIVRNGMMKDLAVLQESPFSDQGSISELFHDVAVFMNLRAVIEGIKRNAMVA